MAPRCRGPITHTVPPGVYEVAKTFYLEFIPEVKQVAGEPLASQLLDKYVYSNPDHRWLGRPTLGTSQDRG
jgi:hypothetical protein